MDKTVIEEKIKNAIKILIAKDGFLLQEDVHERSISHKLAEYLQQEFEDWHVDCEYNRDNHQPKRLKLPVEQVTTDNPEAKTVYPDIIVHRRGSDDNLLVIEIKKSTSQGDDNFDWQKLSAFKQQLKYKFAVFIKFSIGENCERIFEKFEFQED